jgi:hypothetical protein
LSKNSLNIFKKIAAHVFGLCLLIFLIVSFLGIDSTPSPAWSMISGLLALSSLVPFLPQFLCLSRLHPLAAAFSVVALPMAFGAFYVLFAYSFPAVLVPLTGQDHQMVMTVSSTEVVSLPDERQRLNPCRWPDLRVRLKDSSGEIRTRLCVRRTLQSMDYEFGYKTGRQVVMKGKRSWFGTLFNEMWPLGFPSSRKHVVWGVWVDKPV